MSVDWSKYNDERFSRVNDIFLPASGEGDNRATQLVTAVNKLIYKWYNDGDVFDNTGTLEGWANDLSSYANWIYRYFPRYRNILDRVFECYNDSDYEDLLWQLAEASLDLEILENLSQKDKVGSIYDCSGPFEFREDDEDDHGEYYDEEYDDDYDDYDRDYAPEDEDIESAVDINAADKDNDSIAEEEISEEEEFENLVSFMKDDFELILASLDKLERGSSEDLAVGRTIAKTLYSNIQDALAAIGERF